MTKEYRAGQDDAEATSADRETFHPADAAEANDDPDQDLEDEDDPEDDDDRDGIL